MSSSNPQHAHPIVASAPGKVVMAGEYAVLTGAPAIVMAVNRFARCTLSTIDSPVWAFTANGFAGRSEHLVGDLKDAGSLSREDPARLCAWLLHHATPAQLAALPAGIEVRTDTSEMYHGANKLGLGSSAALITAQAGALALLQGGATPGFEAIHKAHQLSQGGVGSGLDIATSLKGGVIHFAKGETHPISWPEGLHYRFVYAGKPASTTELVGRFNDWHQAAQKTGQTDAITTLFNRSSTLANQGISLDNLACYIHALRALDEAATIGIFSSEHEVIATAAEQHKVLYKPCGAGGGDLGVALSDNTDDLNRFAADIGKNFAVIDLEIAPYGLTIG